MTSGKIILKIAITIAIIYCFNLFSVIPVQATESSLWGKIQSGGLLDIGKYGFQLQNPEQPKTVPTIAGQTINTLLGLLGILFVVLIVYSGYLWMTAAGDDDQVGTAKSILKNAIIGVLLILAAYSITIFILRSFLVSTGGSSNTPTFTINP